MTERDMDDLSTDDDEFTTEDVRAMSAGADEEAARIAGNRRSRGVDVAQGKTAKRGQTTPAQEARNAQQAQRENPLAWRPSTSLEAPPAPRGFVLRWIRDKMGNSDDPRNVSRKMREGWTPYLLKDAPDSYVPPEIGSASIGDTIRVGDLLLCKMPIERFRMRKKYFADKAIRQKKAVQDKFRGAEDPRLGEFEREYKEQASTVRTPRVQADA